LIFWYPKIWTIRKNLDNTLSQVFIFSALHDGLILRISLQRKKFTAICCAVHGNELYTGLWYFRYLPVARN